MLYNTKHHRKGFSIIEVLVGIFIFSLGLTSIFMLLASSLNLNERNQNQIIASNLAREQLELFRNVRDTNYKTLRLWDLKNPEGSITDTFTMGGFYTLENNFASGFSITVDELVDFGEGVSELEGKMQNYRLYLTPDGLYTYQSAGNTPTYFYRYLTLSPVEYTDGGTQTIADAYKVTSKVIWYKRGYHSLELDTIVADWRRI